MTSALADLMVAAPLVAVWPAEVATLRAVEARALAKTAGGSEVLPTAGESAAESLVRNGFVQ